MGSGEKHNNNMINFDLNLLHHNQDHDKDDDHDHQEKSKEEIKGVPKGCMVVLVGHEAEEQLHRFVIPVMYVKHPLFIKLLKEAEDEYGFNHKGPITIPCHVDEFRHVQDMIDKKQHVHHHHHDHHRHHHDHRHHHNFLCFKA